MNALVVGLGSIAAKHIAAIRKIDPFATITALRRSNSSKTVDGVINIFDVSQLDASPDLVIIASPTAEHAQSVLRVSKTNCPLFIEKPIAHNLESAEKLIAAIGKRRTYVGCNMRFLECVQFLREHLMVWRPRVNEVNFYCGSYLPEWRRESDFRTSYSVDPMAGGGVHLDLIHELDLAYWLFGVPDTVTRNLRNVSSLEIAATDYAHYLLNYSKFSASITLNYYRRDPRREIEVVFENDTWIVNLLTNTINSSLTGAEVFKDEKRIKDTYTSQFEYFLKNAPSDKMMMNDVNEAFEVLKICLQNEA